MAPCSPFKAPGEQQLAGGVDAAQLWAGLAPCSWADASQHPPVPTSCCCPELTASL